MVLSAAPLSRTGPVKRSASSLGADSLGWETAPVMNSPLRATVNMPFTHYSLIYLDHMGHLQVQESPSINDQNLTVFTNDVREKFLEILGSKINYSKPLIRSIPAALSYDRMDEKYRRQAKRRKTQPAPPSDKLQYSNPDTNAMQDLPPVAAVHRVALMIGDSDKVLRYYQVALKHFQQTNCRVVCKAFIKVIEPRKQVRHPYNGGRAKPGAPPGSRGDPELTKPAWWPAHVIHREPDHLKKNERLELLLHIIRNLSSNGFTAEALQEVAHDCRRQIQDDKMPILNEIFRVRKMEERYERGEIDATTIVYVQAREDKEDKEEKEPASPAEPVQKIEPEETEANEVIIPATSSMADFSAQFTAMDSAGMSTHRATSLEADRGQLFPLPESLSYGESTQTDRSFYSTSGDYSDDYSSHPTIKTPTSIEMVSPIEPASSFEYLAHAPLTTTDGAEHHRTTAMSMQHSIGPYDTWAAPTYRQQPLYGSYDYSAAVTTQAMSQPAMHYQIPMDEMHGLPELTSTRMSPFRTGSLGHPTLTHQSPERL
ncbi:uncharacterized protein BO97DRAFT_386653 [Aspergillus homomorphus CBS 101889]|uniref:Subtelomeric hrmA-associated cluster protein AFUB-079030/YDR124W-like helical bundle domain-containing protein n=1 Tax=Aspergillus homomorphus (strain CBS 101889) TaxID=1450537 RepID=A0A395I2Q1_ASPHC|nr:hypothetical protein BO97DRAFT_386653 [Aspergillus homomorphus CBS 101889]RAL14207.1 hypothetical protein BO97DRAFT_386653 [Aspergillus homomorphus CBS 101889]